MLYLFRFTLDESSARTSPDDQSQGATGDDNPDDDNDHGGGGGDDGAGGGAGPTPPPPAGRHGSGKGSNRGGFDILNVTKKFTNQLFFNK